MKIKGILFDLDGTLIDSLAAVRNTMLAACKEMNIKAEEEKFMNLIGTPLHYMAEMTVPEGRVDEFLDNYHKLYHIYCKKTLKLYNGIEDLLNYLNKQGLKMAIVTSKAKEGTMNNLHYLGIEDKFDAIITAYDAPKAKPNPDPVEFAAYHLDIAVEQCVMIGDTFFDIEAGNKAGAKTIAVTWGNATKDDLAKSNPTYMVSSISQLKDLLIKLTK